jgi:transposase
LRGRNRELPDAEDAKGTQRTQKKPLMEGVKLTPFHGRPTVPGKEAKLARKRGIAYPAEFRQQIVELARAGRTATELSREFGPTRQCIAHWIEEDRREPTKAHAASEPLNSCERAELARLRAELHKVKQERDILAKATAWFAAKDETTPTPSTNS